MEIPELFGRVFLQDEAVKIAVSKGTGHWRFVYAMNDRWPEAQSFEALDSGIVLSVGDRSGADVRALPKKYR